MSATTKKIHLVRHAQAEHNVGSDWTIRDAPLTDLGREQSIALLKRTRDGIQQTAQLLVSSPMRRTLETTLKGFATLKERLEKEGKNVVLLDILQEVEANPCDTPLPVSELKTTLNGIFEDFDFSSISPEFTTKGGIFHPDNVEERARRVRLWLRDREEEEIIVVAHGDLLRYVNGQYPPKTGMHPWDNTEVRLYTFVSSSDQNATLIEISPEVEGGPTSSGPTSSEM
ncbi:hypothetical protein TREMEDRAFT_35661 [Tremella mesenterica DSM 1558]|uniref:uncharacterized protein n=1 Tax=Tremella mesenterica (strain ATCC 24925 / CBS 8224 / DSM 1558 / NBRC 9311 / NRRL Y-6157 / RJB 2259-6 / UBC 559-6) TaxID=578456 RepID=UPI00032C2E15|nr:uncharacterized protein TREMEDRAFT_35661 [Tremella mesenterica DSM 1558]EIW65902.1 hypothetical protein TREMEDRAFT_35661 [Tremella mesenterica DSM 1558]